MGALGHTFCGEVWKLTDGVIEREGKGEEEGLGAASEDLSRMLAFVC